MPIEHHIWQVGAIPKPLASAQLPSEAQLEDMIVSAPEMLSSDWMIIGRQEDTGFGGRIDLLALAPDGAVILIELKRDKTPRDVVAQALDYATWVVDLDVDDLGAMYKRFSSGGDLGKAYAARFGQPLDEETLNDSHQIVIVAASLDAGTERIISYLNERDIAVNVLFFQVFQSGDNLLLSRAWLHDPVESQVAASSSGGRSSEKEPWNGEYYASYGHNMGRTWEEAVEYGFIAAGGGAWYSGTLKVLKPGDRVWVKAPGFGFVGVGRVTNAAVPASEFTLPGPDGDAKPALEVLTGASYHREHENDLAKCEWFVKVDWAQTVPITEAFNEVGLFGNQNTVCAPKSPKWRHTVERLKQVFTNYDAV
jgi:hypothetical protein